MNVDIKMPDLATTDSEVTIIRWLIEIGQPVKLGQPLLEIETDKASMEVESVAAGTLQAIHIAAGEQAGVGQIIATIATRDSTPKPEAKASPVTQSTQPAPATAPVVRLAETAPGSRISFFARNKAARAEAVTALAAGTADVIPMSTNQREVARRMLHSKRTIPHFYLTTSANAERMIAIRAEAAKRGQKIAWDAFFVQAAARALQAFDRMSYRIDGDKLVRRTTNSVGVAVDLDDLLYVIAVDHPLSTTVEQISQQITAMVERIRRNEPGAKTPSETCLSVTNLGAENIETFLAIVNSPEAAILAVGKVAPTVVPLDDQVVIQKRVSLSLSVDHRIVNGKYAAKFLSRIVTELESF